MKIFLKLVSVILLLAMIYLALANLSQSVNMAVFVGFYQVKLVYAAMGFLLAGFASGLLWLMADYSGACTKLKEYQRKLEKTSINSDEGSSKVAVLEAKIQTLEKALQSALENRD